jgi:hypothetical protein
MPRLLPPHFARALCCALAILACAVSAPATARADAPADTALERWPRKLEMDFALSALPPHLRDAATVYALDPAAGYEVARQGSNGFSCLISRTEWEWADFPKDHATPICWDAEGAKAIMQVYLDVAKLRAGGKQTPAQIHDLVADRFKKGLYKAPARPGISYMLAPLMRTYPQPGAKTIVTMHMPHYMFYALGATDRDIGGKQFSEYPFVLNPAGGPHGYMILLAGETERAKILADQQALVKQLCDYRSYLCLPPPGAHKH